MSDQIVGTAILTEPSPHDGYEYLFVVCSSPSRKTVDINAIPIRERGKPNPGNRGWQYTMRGEYLDVTPSLKVSVPTNPGQANSPMREVFHNSAAWSVKFARATLAEASTRLRELNPDWLKDSSAADIAPSPGGEGRGEGERSA